MSRQASRWEVAVTTAVGVRPGELDRRGELESRMKAVWFGLMSEFHPPISLKEMARLAGCRAETHTTAHSAVARWKSMHWRDRYGWLILADSFYAAAENDGEWRVSDVAEQSVAEAFGWRRQAQDRLQAGPRAVRIRGHYDER
jgi:hypothetical protein